MTQNPDPISPGAAHPPLALPEFIGRCMGNAAVATLVLDKFECQLRSDVRQIQEQLAARDAVQIARTAHTLKGSAGATSAAALQVLAASIEAMAREGRLDSIAGELAELRSEVDRCLGYLPIARTMLNGAAADRARGETGR